MHRFTRAAALGAALAAIGGTAGAGSAQADVPPYTISLGSGQAMIGDPDPNVQIVFDSLPEGPVPRAASIIAPNALYHDPFDTTHYISATTDGMAGTSTTYGITFTLPTGAEGLHLGGKLLADNAGVVLLNNKFIGGQTVNCGAPTTDNFTTPFNFGDNVDADFVQGTNTLDFIVVNCEDPDLSGLDFKATVKYRTAEISVDPTELTFPTTETGTSSPAKDVTITNNGNGALRDLDYTPPPDYTVDHGTCPVGHNPGLAAGDSCTIHVTLAPTTAGDHNGPLEIDSNATNGAAFVTLNGDACQASCFSGTDDSGQARRYTTFTTAQITGQSDATRVGSTVRSIQVTIDWGDGTTTTGTAIVTASGEISIQGKHYYRHPGTYDVTTTIIDGRGTANHNQGDTTPQVVHSQITIT